MEKNNHAILLIQEKILTRMKVNLGENFNCIREKKVYFTDVSSIHSKKFYYQQKNV